MILLIGPSASGKTEVGKLLCSKYNFKKAVTTTTRPPRDGEIDKVDYFFITKNDFETLANQNYFVETTLYSGNFYGCGKDQIEDNKYVILDPNGLKSFSLLNNKRIVSFLFETDEKIRETRMILRGDKAELIQERLKNDRELFNNVKVNYIIKNENKDLNSLAEEVIIKYNQTILSLNK